jgi:type I restriction enzyme S subunit
LQKGEIANRWDVFFNWALRNTNLNFAYPTQTLESFTSSFSGGTPSKNIPSYWEGDILWTSPKDMKSFYLVDTEDKISEQAILDSATKIAELDTVLIVVRSGILIHTLPVAVVKQETAINQDIKAYVTKDHVLPEYLAVFLRIFEKSLLPLIIKHSTTVQSINTEQFDKLPIPIPPKDVQIQIIEKYTNAIKQQNNISAQAQTLLSSIDTYLLEKLGIQQLPHPSVNLSERVFLSQFNDIDGVRIDPHFHKNEFKVLENHLNSGHYKHTSLKIISTKITSGATPKSGGDDYVTSSLGIPFIRSKLLSL